METSDEEDERRKRKSRKVQSVMESDSGSEEELKTKRKSRKVQEELEEESSDEGSKWGKRKAVRKKKDIPRGEEEARKEVQSKTVDMDVDGIVQWIQSLKFDDSKYAVCYFKLLEVKPMVAQLLPSPFQHMHSVPQYYSSSSTVASFVQLLLLWHAWVQDWHL